jgi:hypothetical protein
MKTLLLTLALTSATFAATPPQTFVGVISDSQCALNVHSKTGSHQEMTVTRWETQKPSVFRPASAPAANTSL